MRLARVFHADARPGAEVVFWGEEFRHVATVLRRRRGDPVVVLDGCGGVFRGEITSLDAGRQRLEVRVVDRQEEPPLPIHSLTVAVAIPRGDGLELAIRLASETGLAALQPLITARTVARPRGGSNKLARWRRIARESAEQCRRSAPIEVTDPIDWEPFLAGLPAGDTRRWIAVPGGPSPVESGLLDALRPGNGPLLVTIGPEGGFTPGEVGAAVDAGLRPLGFPSPILKTPTAVVYVGALASLRDLAPDAVGE